MTTVTSVASQLHGVGLGLRPDHYTAIEKHLPAINWLEFVADNYLETGGIPCSHLQRISAHYPLAQHSVGMSLGGSDPLNWSYLNQIKNLAHSVDAKIISDHLCWVSHGAHYYHDLFPLPYTTEAISHVVDRIQQVQDFLGQRIAIENVSSYLSFKCSEMSEWEFICAILERADCGLLLDINNVYVSARNHHFDPMVYLEHIPVGRVMQFHLAGFEENEHFLLDDHGSEVAKPVWELYRQAVARFGSIPTLIEWDNNIPNIRVLLAQAKKAKSILQVRSYEVV